MRSYFSILFLSILIQPLFGQIGQEFPADWSIKTIQENDSTYQIQFIADVEPGWYIYSQHVGEGGPIPMQFTFEENENLFLQGEVEETADEVKTGFDDTFKMDVIKLIGRVVFTQEVKVTEPSSILEGNFKYQVCKEVCYNGNEQFAIKFDENKTAIGEEAVDELLGRKTLDDPDAATIWPTFGEPVGDCENPAAAQDTDNSSNWGIFFLGLLGGAFALLTPCVFPMIPLTVTFFTKRHENKSRGVFEAILYGFCIFLIYFLLAVPFLLIDLPQDTLYRISTSPILNLIFFAIFIFFAISLFGYFEIGLPSNWANKTDSISNKGGLIGIFFMAITLAIVSFSCTGPILGSLMAGTLAKEGSQLKLVYGMSGFGVALGLPFALFAMFPGILKKLPKSGSWMNTVKVFLAFVEVAFALKFLSNADIVRNWGILKYEIFLALWILVALGLAAYLFGWIRFPHDYKGQKISIPRKAFALFWAIFAMYLFTGFTGNQLNLVSGFPPPKHYSIFKQEKFYIDNYEEGLAKARAENKPILLDFTGYTCVNCRKVEDKIWTAPEVDQRLREDFILVSLYADDSKKLPKSYKSSQLKKTVRTYGDKWTDFEATSFGKIAQPLYAIISPEEELLNTPIAFTESVDNYIAFLDCGIEAYRELETDN